MTYVIWLLVLVSLGVIGTILFRKFSVLANIDVANIESEKQAALKQRIISEKLQRRVKKVGQRLWRIFKPIFKVLNSFFGWAYRKLWDLKDRYSQRDLQSTDSSSEKIAGLFVQAQDLWRREDLAEAENKYIEIIGLDSKNFKAFQLLGELYMTRQNYAEAEQTFSHAIKLRQVGEQNNDKEVANIYFNLSLATQAQSDYQSAIANMKQALQIDPNNPRCLDKMLELCIITKDKGEAWLTYKKLAEVNPDNQKLEDLKQKINDL